jgi:GDP-4-dehydro-6-deoxy-D-mannose reductase
MEKGSTGDLFVVSSGQTRSIQSLLDGLLALSDVRIEVVSDPERMRPVNNPVLLGDSRRLQQATGWTPEITFEQSLADIMDDCRQRVAQEGKA